MQPPWRLPLHAFSYLDSSGLTGFWHGLITPHWEILEPSAAGWSIDLLDEARSYAAAAGSSAVMIVQHGRVIAALGDTSRGTDVVSVRKSLLSALLGIAIAEGKVKLTGTLANLGIDDKPQA